MRVAVTGGSGVLGTALRGVRPKWEYWNRADCDVLDFAKVRATLLTHRPDVVLHAAALTDHQHPNAAEVIETNIVGTQNVATLCALFNVPLVYVSTHYVYAGIDGNYDENSREAPIGTYAMSKFAGELVAAFIGALVVRGSWYTRETRLDKWAQRGALVDAWCSREPVADAARKIVALVEARTRGVVNIGGARRSFAQILRDEGYRDFPLWHRFQAQAQFDLPYEFPADTSVSTAKFDALGLDWRNVRA